jgi:prevent-host-death family protein
MREIGAYEAKTHLPELLRDAANGKQVRITNRGRPVARLVPDQEDRPDPAQVIEAIRALRRGKRLDADASIKSLIEEGRE